MDEFELAKLAAWAEKEERQSKTENRRRAAGAIRQGADWLLREYTLERQEAIKMNQPSKEDPTPIRKN